MRKIFLIVLPLSITLAGDIVLKYLFAESFSFSLEFDSKYITYLLLTILLIVTLLKSSRFTIIEEIFMTIIISGLLGNLLFDFKIYKGYNLADLFTFVPALFLFLSLFISGKRRKNDKQ